jgi:hypothetical protein
VDAEERQVRVGNRVDERPDQVAALRPEPEVDAAEGNDARLGGGAGGDRQPV